MKKTLLTTLLLLILSVAGYSYAFADADASLELKPSVAQANKDEEFNVDIVLKNPQAQNVISVRSWLEYDASALEAENIDSSKSLFTLSAPGEDEVSAGEGRVKIGRSNITGGVKDTETVVATVKFKVLAATAESSKISFYDYQVSELGHTSVNIIDSGFPSNILSEEPKSIDMNLNPGAPAAVAPTPTPVITTPVQTPVTNGIGGGLITNSALMRPTNLRANTGPGYVDLVWDAAVDPGRMGYNIYYGTVSGQYSRRRTIENLNGYRLDGLNNSETYYLAITAYDQNNQESDYSNEVGIIVNQQLSSTNPYTTLLEGSLSKIPAQPQNGPLVGWLLFSAVGLSAAILYGRKKHNLTSESAIG
jgi:hypothetical protein